MFVAKSLNWSIYVSISSQTYVGKSIALLEYQLMVNTFKAEKSDQRSAHWSKTRTYDTKWQSSELSSLIGMFNTLRPRQYGRHFADDVLNCIFLNENVWIPIENSLMFVPKGSINNNPALFQIMAWCRPGDKPLSEQVMVSLLTHICFTWPQWVKIAWHSGHYYKTKGTVLK